jgi:uncharacterized protein (DUF2236 family)
VGYFLWDQMPSSLFPAESELGGLLVGPESVSWRYTSDARLYLVMLYPLLLQVAHPTVDAGVRDHSDFDLRPWSRLVRTIDYLTLLVYGGQDAVGAGRRLRALHRRFRGVRADGRRYSALEPEAYAWVHATLLDSFVAGHAQFGRPMSPPERDRFYREYRGLGRLVGVRKRDLPEDWTAFRAYFDGVVRSELVRTASVDRVIRSVRGDVAPPVPMRDLAWRAIRMPARRGVWLGGAGLLGPRLRDRLGIGWSRVDELQYRALGAFTRRLDPIMPPSLKVCGPAQLQYRSAAIDAGPLGAMPERPARRVASRVVGP